MKYFKLVLDGYIHGIGIGYLGEEINKEEYEKLKRILENKPNIVDNSNLKLKTNLEWKICETVTSSIESEESEVTQQEYAELYERLTKVEATSTDNSNQITQVQEALCEIYEQIEE